MTRTEKAWLAGIVDGEGTFVAYIREKDKHRLLNVRIAVVNRHPRLIEKVRLLFEEVVGRPVKVSSVDNSKGSRHGQLCYAVAVWRIEDVVKLARFLIPHLVAKRDQAVLFAEYLEKRGTHRYRQDVPVREDMMFASRIKSMNARYHWSPRTDCMGDLPDDANVVDEETVGTPRIREGGESSAHGSA